jgi:hypothetical protein
MKTIDVYGHATMLFSAAWVIGRSLRAELFGTTIQGRISERPS